MAEKEMNRTCQRFLELLKEASEGNNDKAVVAEAIRAEIHKARYIEEPLEYIKGRSMSATNEDGSIFRVDFATRLAVEEESFPFFAKRFGPLDAVSMVEMGATNYYIFLFNRIMFDVEGDQLILT